MTDVKKILSIITAFETLGTPGDTICQELKKYITKLISENHHE